MGKQISVKMYRQVRSILDSYLHLSKGTLNPEVKISEITLYFKTNYLNNTKKQQFDTNQILSQPTPCKWVNATHSFSQCAKTGTSWFQQCLYKNLEFLPYLIRSFIDNDYGFYQGNRGTYINTRSWTTFSSLTILFLLPDQS